MSLKPASRSRLGRGIGALLAAVGDSDAESASLDAPPAGQTADTPPDSLTDITRLPVGDIAANPFQPRRQFDDASIRELADSLLANGLIQPIVVAAVGAGYQLIAGERRLRAAKLAGFIDVPVVVRQVDEATQARLALVENIHREDLNPLDRAQCYAALLASSSLTQQELAAALGDQRSTVANHLRLLDLPAAVQDLVRDRKLSLGHAKVLAGVQPPPRLVELAVQCVDAGWSVRQLEAACSSDAAEPKRVKQKNQSVHINDLGLQISRALSLRAEVQPSSKPGSGRVIVHYASLDEFDALLSRLGIDLEQS